MLAVVILALLVTSASCNEEKTVFGKLKSGFQMAGKLLGIDQANGVAQLVTEAFGKTHRKGDGSEGTGNIFSGFLRILGFDSKKIGAIAVNAIIFVAQLISSSLTRPYIPHISAARMREGSPLDWMMSSPTVIQMFSDIRDKELPNNIIMYIKERSLDEETDCVQLLVCKSAPFIWGMQKVLDGNSTVKGPKSFYAYLPTLEEVTDHADNCDKNHPYCFIHL